MNAVTIPIRAQSLELSAVLYRSIASLSGADFEASNCAAEFAERNRRTDITGYLHFEYGSFYQYFEGPSPAVATLWQSIQNDPRHRDIELLSRRAAPVRRFERWAMGYNRDEPRSLFDWTSRSGLALKGPKLPQVITAFLEYSSAVSRSAR